MLQSTSALEAPVDGLFDLSHLLGHQLESEPDASFKSFSFSNEGFSTKGSEQVECQAGAVAARREPVNVQQMGFQLSNPFQLL